MLEPMWVNTQVGFESSSSSEKISSSLSGNNFYKRIRLGSKGFYLIYWVQHSCNVCWLQHVLLLSAYLIYYKIIVKFCCVPKGT